MGIGAFRHLGLFQNPAAAVPDGEGGWVEGWADLDPAEWPISITPATVRDLERVGAGTILTTATHVIEARWRGDVSTKTRITFDGRIFHITGIQNPEERNIRMRLVAEEQL
jgi:SPP1 family predicted phage head-tail adaptor